MKSPLVQNTTKSAKAMAQQIAKQMAQEPLEVLKAAREQTFGPETPKTQENFSEPSEGQQTENMNRQKLQDEIRSERRMEALNRELNDIRKHDLFKDLQHRISEGEEVPLEDYTELSLEQKQVLKAETEAVKIQKSKMQGQNEQTLVEPASKHGRKFGPTRKQEVEKQQTHVEKPVPPSG